MIVCNQVSLLREDKTILNHIDVQLQCEDIHFIVGANGSGKSSLLRCLSGFIQPDKGSIIKPKSLLYQPQHPHLFGPKVRHNFDDLDQATSYLDQLGLNDVMNTSTHKLSGGEKQKVAFVRSLLQRTELYLLDEPSSQLDTSSKQMMLDMIKHHQKQMACTFIIVTHDQDFIRHTPIYYEMIEGRIYQRSPHVR